MSREISIDVHRLVKCDRCGHSVSGSKNFLDTNGNSLASGGFDHQAGNYANAASGWEADLRYRANALGFPPEHGNENAAVGFRGELCGDCARALKEVLDRFFADGVAGMLGVVKEQEKDTHLSIPVNRCPIIHVRTDEQCIRHAGHSGLHYIAGVGLEFS